MTNAFDVEEESQMSTYSDVGTQGSGDDEVLTAVKRVVVRESRLSVDPAMVADDEPLDGKLLRVTSLGLLGMLIRLEEDLDATLPDDMFTGQKIHTVADLADVVRAASRAETTPS